VNKKIKVIILPVLLAVFTVAVSFVSYLSSDIFYISLALIVDIFFILLLYPKLLSSKHLGLPNIKKPRINLEKSDNSRNRWPSFSFKRIRPIIKIRSRVTLFYLFATLIISLFSTYLVVYKLGDGSSQSSLVLSYLTSIMAGVTEYVLPYIIALVTMVSVIFFLIKDRKRVEKMLLSLSLTFSGALLSIFLTLALTFAFSIVDVSNLKRRIVTNPQSVGVFVETDKIVDELHNFENPPNIMGDDKNIEGLIVSIKTQDRGSFYKNKIVPSVVKVTPYKLDLSSNPVLLVDNNIIITKIDKEKIEAVSSVVGKLFVEKALAPRLIKDEPDVSLMGRQEYLKYRDDQINEAVQKIEDALTEIENGINILYANISRDKQMIASNESGISESISSRDAAYQNCITAGYHSYYFGTFYRYYTDSYCNNLKAEWDGIVAQYQQNVQDWRDQLAYDQQALAEYQEYQVLLSDYRDLVASQKDQTPYELGLFEPDKSVKVVLENTDTSSLADFYATLTHEYLHYTSYVSEERQLDGFFEEGLTEYFARKTIKDNLDIDTNLGYPLISNIILEMVKKIPEERLEEIYFTKDHDALVGLLNQTYGDSFYEDSQLYFTIIQYVPSREALKVANNIMFKIGGEDLTEEDLLSTYSELN
jgi:hypothetical protein